MTTSYTNSLAYYQTQNALQAAELGYIDTILRGASPMGLVPIVPTSHFMHDKYFERQRGATKITTQRKLNEEPDAKSFQPFAEKNETTAIYTRRTDIDIRLAEQRPQVYDQMLTIDGQDLVTDIDYDIINGVPDDTGYGLRGLEDRIAISNTGYDVNNGAALVINTSDTTFKSFLKLFRKAVDKIKLSRGMTVVAFCNESVEQAISSGRDLLGASTVGYGVNNIIDQRVTTVDGIPLVKLRADSVGTDLLPFDENGESSTSIWICGIGGAPGEGSMELPNGMVILSSDEIIRRRTHQTLTQIQTMQEIDVGLRVPPGSVVRLSRLKVA